jgi:hypothetical protein
MLNHQNNQTRADILLLSNKDAHFSSTHSDTFQALTQTHFKHSLRHISSTHSDTFQALTQTHTHRHYNLHSEKLRSLILILDSAKQQHIHLQ